MKQKIAKAFGWGQLAIVYINQILSQNGGVLPTTRQGWLNLAGSAALAYGVHTASETSAGHPNGAVTK